MSADILVLSACTGDKAINPPVVGCADIDESSQTSLLEAHPNVSLPAKSLYTGNEHNHVEAAVDQLMKIAEVDWRIISAGFGLVSPKTHLPSYECTFNDDESVRERVKWLGQNPELLTKAEQRQVVAEELGVPADIEHALADGYDLAFVVLGEDYLHATGSALSSLPDETIAFAFAPEGNRDLIGDCRWVPSTETEREAHSTTWMQIKGRQFRTVTDNVVTTESLSDLNNPETVRKLSLPTT